MQYIARGVKAGAKALPKIAEALLALVGVYEVGKQVANGDTELALKTIDKYSGRGDARATAEIQRLKGVHVGHNGRMRHDSTGKRVFGPNGHWQRP